MARAGLTIDHVDGSRIVVLSLMDIYIDYLHYTIHALSPLMEAYLVYMPCLYAPLIVS